MLKSGLQHGGVLEMDDDFIGQQGLPMKTVDPVRDVEHVSSPNAKAYWYFDAAGVELDSDDSLSRVGGEDRVDHIVRFGLRDVHLLGELFSEFVLGHCFPSVCGSTQRGAGHPPAAANWR